MILLKETGIVPLLKLIKSFEKVMGKRKARELLETSPQTLLELLEPSCICIDERNVVNGKISLKNRENLKWSEDNFDQYLNKLKLTSFQTIILKSLVQSNKPTTLKGLEDDFKVKGIDITTGSMIGGSLAGITKKCKAYDVPELILSRKTNVGEYKYTLVLEKDLREKLKETLSKNEG